MAKPPKLARWTKLRQRAQQTQVKSRRSSAPTKLSSKGKRT